MQKCALVKALGLTFGAVLMTACASNSDLAEGEELQPLDAAVQETSAEVETKSVEAQEVVSEQGDAAAAEAQAALMDVTVFYFDFDNTTIKSDSKNTLIAHSQYLAANSSARVILEGHADERGTVEYNLALGERRADTVKRYLIVQGANPSQLESVSFGEERPAMLESDESSWSKNRRTEIQYQAR